MASQKTFKGVDTKVVVDKALKELKDNNLIEDFKKHEIKIIEVLKKAAVTEDKLTKEMFHMVDKISVKDIEKKMAAIIGQDRVNFIKKAFTIETYRMKLVKKPNGKSVVQVHRCGTEFRPEINLMTIRDVESSAYLQWAGVLVEVFILVLTCVGLKVELNDGEIKAVTITVEEMVQQPAFQKALSAFEVDWIPGSTWERAKAIFHLLTDTYSSGFFWTIVNLLFTKMSTFEKIRALAECSLMIVAAFATDGAALIARIALAVDSAAALVQKMVNISHFAAFKKTL